MKMKPIRSEVLLAFLTALILPAAASAECGYSGVDCETYLQSLLSKTT